VSHILHELFNFLFLNPRQYGKSCLDRGTAVGISKMRETKCWICNVRSVRAVPSSWIWLWNQGWSIRITRLWEEGRSGWSLASFDSQESILNSIQKLRNPVLVITWMTVLTTFVGMEPSPPPLPPEKWLIVRQRGYDLSSKYTKIRKETEAYLSPA